MRTKISIAQLQFVCYI